MSEGSTSSPWAEPEGLRSPGLVAPILGGALILAAVVVAWSPFFSLKQVEVAGNRNLSDAQVSELAGVALGENLNAIAIRAVEASLLRSPWISQARARRDLPGTLLLELTERRPAGVISGPRGEGVVAADGVVVQQGREGPATGPLPMLGRVRAGPAPGQVVSGRASDVLLRVAASFPARLRAAVRALELRGRDVELALRRGGTVRYGPPDGLAQKNAAIVSMLRYARQQGVVIDYIDVRSPSSPALKPAAPA